jgi:hypothetical protein
VGTLAADDGRLVSTFHVVLANEQKWVGFFSAHSGFVPRQNATGSEPAIRAEMGFPVNHLAGCGRDNAKAAAVSGGGAVAEVAAESAPQSCRTTALLSLQALCQRKWHSCAEAQIIHICKQFFMSKK